MSRQKMTVDAAEPHETWLYRVGGLSGFIIGIGYIAIIALYVPMGAPPSGAEARLAYLSANTAAWWSILGLSVLTDFLFVPLAFALYVALREIDKSAMLAATACVALFVLLDLALTWTNYAALITLSGNYAAAVNNAERTIVVAAAIYPSAVLESSLLFVYNTLTLSAGILLTGFVMRKGIFGRATAYLGIVTGMAGIASVAGSFLVKSLSAGIIFASVLTTVWVLLAGYRLYRLGWS